MNPNILIDVSKIPALLQQEYQFIDIRDKASYTKEHFQKFKNIPFQNNDDYKKYLNKHIPTIFICYSGTQSHRLAQYLNSQGYDCYSIQGGFYNVKVYQGNHQYY